MFAKPNTTPFPDELIDIHLKNLSGSEFKILSVIIRKTFGFHKVWDFISISQLEDITGMSRTNITETMPALESKNFIKSAFVCPKCNTIVKYMAPKKDEKHDYVCTDCNTKEPPNKWYALNISGDNMEKYLVETLGIKTNGPGSKGSQKNGLPQRGGSQKNGLPGSQKNGLPPVFEKKSYKEASDNNSQDFSKRRGSQKNGLTINNTINNAQKTSLSHNNVPGPVVQKKEKKDFKSESESDLKSQEKSKDEKNHSQGIKLIEEFYPFYFVSQMGGPMNSEKNKLLARIGESYDSDPVTTRSLIADVAKNLERPSNLLAWAVERIDKAVKNTIKDPNIKPEEKAFLAMMERYQIPEGVHGMMRGCTEDQVREYSESFSREKNVVEPGLIEHERLKQEESDPETVKRAFSNIFAMLDQKDKEKED